MYRRRRLQILLVAGLVAASCLLGALVWLGYGVAWTGFGATAATPKGGTPAQPVALVPASHTLWDWLQLLIVPASLTVGVWWLSTRQGRTDRALARAGQQEEALQAYLDTMAGLLLDRGLRTAEPNAEVWSVARARTRAMLRRLDGERKGDLLEFLAEAGLIGRDRTGIDLAEADLGEADLVEADLRTADLGEADLSEANLSKADLRGAELRGADLRGADLTGATLHGADLTGADLTGATLDQVVLREAKVTVEQLGRARSASGALLQLPVDSPEPAGADSTGESAQQ
jgi:hypothetical protein